MITVAANRTASAARLAALGESERESLRILLDGLDAHWSLDGLSTLVYAVPKLQAGLDAEAKPTLELKVAQRQFFVLVYELLIGKDTGPRLPTLLLAAGVERVRRLLTGWGRAGSGLEPRSSPDVAGFSNMP